MEEILKDILNELKVMNEEIKHQSDLMKFIYHKKDESNVKKQLLADQFKTLKTHLMSNPLFANSEMGKSIINAFDILKED